VEFTSLRLIRDVLSVGAVRAGVVGFRGFVGLAARILDVWNCRAWPAALRHCAKAERNSDMEDILKVWAGGWGGMSRGTIKVAMRIFSSSLCSGERRGKRMFCDSNTELLFVHGWRDVEPGSE
jgi:hypothetical protein